MPSEPLHRIILAAHGSCIAEFDKEWRSNILERLQKLCPDVQADLAFIMDEHGLNDALSRVEGQTLHILPLCLSDGRFCRDILPSKIAESLSKLNQDVRTTNLRALNENPDMLAGILQKRAIELIPDHQRSKTRLLLVSHGSDNDGDINGLLNTLSSLAPGFDGYQYAYLKKFPSVQEFINRQDQPDLLVLPFFLTKGNHVMKDIPKILGLPELESPFGSHSIHGRTIHYAEPIGTHPDFPEILAGIISKL